MRAIDRRKVLRTEAAAELRLSRGRAELDQEVLADAAGIDASYISRMESRRCKDTWTGVDLASWLLDDETRPVSEHLLRWLAELAGYDVVRRRSMSGTAGALELLGEDLGAATALHQEILRAQSADSEEGTKRSRRELLLLLQRLEEGERVRAQIRGALVAELAALGSRPPPVLYEVEKDDGGTEAADAAGRGASWRSSS